MRIKTIVAMLLLVLRASAQGFFNLTADEVKIDSVLPSFSYSQKLGPDYADSVYTVSIDYPEFIDMHPADVARYQRISSEQLPALPVVDTFVGTSRREGTLHASFVPLVFRDGRYQKLVSFKLTVKAEAVARSRAAHAPANDSTRYASHSVLASGTWAKIRVASTGIYQLTDALVRQAGFSNPSKVKIYGYGGALQPELLEGNYLKATDDLKEVPICLVGGRKLFHASGPVSWSSASEVKRTRNHYSDYGYYFLTESDAEPLNIDSASFIASFYPSADDYHSLHEVDDYAWYHGGRNLYEQAWNSDGDNNYTLAAHDSNGQLQVMLTCNGACEVEVRVNGTSVGKLTSRSEPTSYVKALELSSVFTLSDLQAQNTVTLRRTSGSAEIHLDYISLTQPTAAPLPSLIGTNFEAPQYVYRITNQDHHADPQADMVIIIPTNQKTGEQARRLKTLHESEGLRVNIVPADELFNEFTSGTPDANAYRRYMKMLYDRAKSDADMPRYLLLFADGTWDNRMLTSDWSNTSPDDFLLTYESENSWSETNCYVADEFYGVLDDGEGGKLHVTDTRNRDVIDVGVGRLTARTAAEATILVNKIVNYTNNVYAGDWQNTICFMADDGNGNQHMAEADQAVDVVTSRHDDFNIKKYFWDAYNRTTTSTGNGYPDLERLLKQQMQSGALIMDYCGHGAAYQISHEKVLKIVDFTTQARSRLPLWVTASCDISPFDSHDENIGETAMLNPTGGAIAFLGTTRTVYMGANAKINCAFMKHVLDAPNGKLNTLGDALRLAKNEVWDTHYPYNKLHYQLLGDPAMRLAVPQASVAIDSIGGQPIDGQAVQLKAGVPISVKGHLVDHADFSGTVDLLVQDAEDIINCKLNNTGDQADTAYVVTTRATLYHGTDSVRQGRFNVTFVLSRDMSYSEETGRMLLYALSNDRKTSGHGSNENFYAADASEENNDGIGPSIYCYLNSPSFTNGGTVNTTPYFYAELTDKDGINGAGNGVGHDMQVIVDGSLQYTFSVSEYFRYDFGDYRSGSVGYSLPELSEGEHTLLFRAWDVLNNSSVAELKFRVERGLTPQCFSVACTRNPATTSTQFVINHDRTGSQMQVELEVFDTSGRKLWHHTEQGVSTDNTYTLDWDLTVDGGGRLRTGVYLYRVLISTDGSEKASQARKLIIL